MLLDLRVLLDLFALEALIPPRPVALKGTFAPKALPRLCVVHLGASIPQAGLFHCAKYAQQEVFVTLAHGMLHCVRPATSVPRERLLSQRPPALSARSAIAPVWLRGLIVRTAPLECSVRRQAVCSLLERSVVAISACTVRPLTLLSMCQIPGVLALADSIVLGDRTLHFHALQAGTRRCLVSARFKSVCCVQSAGTVLSMRSNQLTFCALTRTSVSWEQQIFRKKHFARLDTFAPLKQQNLNPVYLVHTPAAGGRGRAPLALLASCVDWVKLIPRLALEADFAQLGQHRLPPSPAPQDLSTTTPAHEALRTAPRAPLACFVQRQACQCPLEHAMQDISVHQALQTRSHKRVP